MKRIGSYALLSLVLVLTGASLPAKAATNPTSRPEMIYFVMLDRFENGDPSNDTGGLAGGPTSTGFLPSNPGFYHGGDLQGLIKRIPYIKSLGFTAIWVTPVVRQLPVAADGKSAAYHGYWGVGFDQVDPHLGTMTDFKNFVSDAHAQDMKVILDIVVNHTADVIHYVQGGSYVGLSDQPYKTVKGSVFDAVKLAGSSKFPGIDQLSAKISFPKTPIIDKQNLTIKSPAWLNDPRNYHNRGDVGQSAESMQYGDFFGLDDLFTESPVVVKGWIDVFSNWITTTGIDGFRIDTARHVNKEFWNAFLPAMRKVAFTQGKTSFPMWGEVADSDPTSTSYWVKQASFNEVLDFPMQAVMVDYINQQDASWIGSYFNNDDFYINTKTNANALGTFLGNHDMGRIGSFIVARTSDATVALKRDQLAHALLFTIRGVPIVYYGDEFGLTGAGDKEARQDLFPTAVQSWQDQFRIGSDPIGTQSSFDTTNPLQDTIRTLTALREQFPALSSGSQHTVYADNGIFAFTRFDAATHQELLIALNSNSADTSATFTSPSPGEGWSLVGGSASVSSNATQTTVKLPTLGWAVFSASAPIPQATAISTHVTLVQPDPVDLDQLEVDATASGSPYLDLAFKYRIGKGNWIDLGIDSAPTFSFNKHLSGFYRVFPLVKTFPAKTAVQFEVVASDSYGVSATSAPVTYKTK